MAKKAELAGSRESEAEFLARVHYFAYGSNMSPRVLAHDEPSIEFVGPARLDGYRLAFTRRSRRWNAGAADVVSADGMCVWGGLYELPREHLESTLDEKEGAGWAYRREKVRVTCDGRSYDAYAYVVVDKNVPELPPSAAYVDELIAGARACRLNLNYIAFLESIRNQPDAEFRQGLVVLPTAARRESEGMGLIKVSPSVAARERLGPLAAVRAGTRACVGKVVRDGRLADDCCEVDQNIRHALGMQGYEMYGSTVTVHPVLARKRRLGVQLVNPRSLFLRLQRPRWMDSEKGIAVVHENNIRLLGLSEGEYAKISFAVPVDERHYRIGTSSFRVFGGAAREQVRDGETLDYPLPDELYLDADGRAGLGVPAGTVDVPVVVSPDVRALFLSRMLFYGATVFLAVVALLPVMQQLMSDDVAVIVTAALSIGLTAVFALVDLRARVRY